MDENGFDLVGKILIAMPDMGDPRFDKSVIYICAHAADGAMGLIVNKPQPKMRFAALLQDLDITPSGTVPDTQIHYGGPVERARGFVLHSDDYRTPDGTLDVDGQTRMTATLDILEDIALGKGPQTALLAIGYSGWGAGQLEQEVMQNAWLTCDADPDIIFGTDNDAKWAAALASIGVSPLLLSHVGGRA